MSVEEKMNKAAPHTLLAIDGGGMRSLISLELRSQRLSV